jgi:hypothetical protein
VPVERAKLTALTRHCLALVLQQSLQLAVDTEVNQLVRAVVRVLVAEMPTVPITAEVLEPPDRDLPVAMQSTQATMLALVLVVVERLLLVERHHSMAPFIQLVRVATVFNRQ